MDSALRPRDIQARIRAGESVEEVAAAAGVGVERIDAFAAPVIAEREHVAGLAQSSPVRRAGEPASNRTLRQAVTEQLLSAGVDPDDVEWDAYLIGSRRWHVKASFEAGEASHGALFVFDLAGRFSTAENRDASWLIGEWTPATPASAAPDESEADASPAADADDEGGETEDAYTETELTEVDGVYDLVEADSDMDALYDMLASFDEDSVKIYAGLVHPELGPDVPLADPAGATSPATPALPEGARVEPVFVPDDVVVARQATPDAEHPTLPEPEEQPALEATAELEIEPTAPDMAPVRAAVEPVSRATPPLVASSPETPPVVTTLVGDGAVASDTGPAAEVGGDVPEQPVAVSAPVEAEVAPEPEQPALVEEAKPTPPRKKPAKRRQRASVPSWDEIMFGSPQSDPSRD